MGALVDIIDDTKTDKNTSHSYLETYERLFHPKKENSMNILEIGIGEPKSNKDNGGSINLWYRYFLNSHIYALDIITIDQVNEEIKNKDRIHLYTGIDAYDPLFIKKEFIEKNVTFDIIIDDGPHTLTSMIDFIKLYLPLLRKNGILIIEDIQSMEWIPNLTEIVPSNLHKNIEIVDLRGIKNRWDDVLFIVTKNHEEI